MGNHHDSIALDWVRGEIQETLKQGQQALETYVENREDTARLRFCLNYLHQVHGTLQMVELFGAALLTEEMEKLTQALLNEQVANVDDAIQALMQAILQLPQYLENLDSSRDDFPLVLLPTLNDLRAARGEALLSDTSLFKPDLTPARIKPAANASKRLKDPTVVGHLRKLRQMYQFALAGIIRETDLDAHYDYLHKVIKRLVKLCQQTPYGELWLAAGGFVETLQSGENPVNTAVKSLLRQLDNEVKRLIDERNSILTGAVPETLLKHLLYYIARARGQDTRYVADLRKRYALDTALPSDQEVDEARNRVSRPGREAIHSVVAALTEELAKLKDQLDLYVRSESRQNSDLEDLIPGLKQVGNTLAVLGLGIPRRVVGEQIETIEALIQSENTPDDGTLMDIAGALLYVEATLSGLDQDRITEGQDIPEMGSQELGEANSALLREARNSLEQVKTAVVNYIASQWNQEEISHVPGLLHSICGALRLIPLERAADQLSSAERYITDVLLEGKRVPDWKQLDTLADAISSIEYYLERMAEGIRDNETVLRIADESLASLGFPVGEAPTWQADIPADELAATADEVDSTPLGPKETDAELLDDEILEIFVEEAREVLDTIHTYYPRLRQSQDDHEALTEVRRAFHTLKGSGRLVGATSIGELAWSVENLFNRVIDNSVRLTDDLFSLTDAVVTRLPGLINEFRDGETSGDVAELIAQAEALATTRKTEDKPASAAVTDAEPEASDIEPARVEMPTAAVGIEATSDADTDDLIDDEILEIFIEEADEVLQTIAEYLPALLREPNDRAALAEIRRAFHTLKGSGRMVGAETIGELSWAVENMLNRVIDGSVFMNDSINELLRQVTEQLPGLVEDFRLQRPASIDTQPLERQANALANGEIPDSDIVPALPTADVAEDIGADAADVAADDDQLVDTVLLEIFESEAETHLQTLQQFLVEAGERQSTAFNDNLSRALHTLKGSAQTAGIQPIAQVVTPLEKLIKDARAENLQANQDVLGLIRELCSFLEQGLQQLPSEPQAPLAGADDYLTHLESVASDLLGSSRRMDETTTAGKPDSQLIQLFLNEGLDILLDADRILDEWSLDPAQHGQVEQLTLELRQLSRGAALTALPDISTLADALAHTYAQAREQDEIDAELFPLAKAAHDHLINMMDQVAAGLATVADDELVKTLNNFAITLNARSKERAAEAASNEPLDGELVEIFLEEAQDLVNNTAETLHQWREQPDNQTFLRLLQRDLHTLKGGARMANIATIGDLAHELESLFEGLVEQRLAVSEPLSDLLLRSHDSLAAMVEAIHQGHTPEAAPELIEAIRRYEDDHQAARQVTDVTPAPAPLPAVEEEEGSNLPEPVSAGETETTGLMDLDPEVAEIFLEEAGEIIDTSGELLHQWQENPQQPDTVKALQRELHTLKGGARMADIAPIADIAHELETLFERIVDGRLQASTENVNLALQAHDQLAVMVEAVAEHAACPVAPALLQALRNAAQGGADVSEEADDDIATAAALAATTDVDLLDEEEASDQLPPALDVEEDAMDMALPMAELSDETAGDLDPELVGIFLEEAYDLINSTGSALHTWTENPADTAVAAELQRDVHTLKGGARMAGVDALGDLTHVLEDLFEQVAEGQRTASEGMNELLFRCHDRLAQMVEQIAAQKPCEAADDLIAEVTALLRGDAAPAVTKVVDETPAVPAADEGAAEDLDENLIGIFLDEGLEILGAIRECLEQWREKPDSLHGVTNLLQELHTLKGGARLADVDPVADLAELWHDRLEKSVEGTVDAAAAFSASEWAANALHTMLTQLEEGALPQPDAAILSSLRKLGEQTAADSASISDDELDQEVLEIFLEEAGEILDQLEQLFSDWRKEPANTYFNQEGQRALHTLKGGARLSQLAALGDLAHELESRLIALNSQAPDDEAWQAISAQYDQIVSGVEDVRGKLQAAVPEAEAKSAPVAEVTPKAETPAPAITEAAPPAPKPAKPPRKVQRPTAADAARAAQETIRVSAPLLDELVNLAGETSITRGRLEQQTSDFSHTLDEMAATIERLREQLRRMDIETEAQILFRTEREHGPDYGDDFDPLEMDRYSSIQQLSRALSESASDLADLRETMADRLRDTETLLVQQSRINTELQEGLMKTRMIPFSSMVPRLRRIVRQISGELGKKVEFDVRNPEGEMDRNILERMVAPLEHMLRNALDHGIEDPAKRAQSGKPETGAIVLSLSREGGEVVLRMTDDGAGIPTKVIRDKAVRQGLMAEQEVLTDREILQFILQPGFSTAQKVTQISGRGVGMDVVASEIKQLGGSLDIDSALGQGTTFTVRLPFTVSVNRALMVSTGEDYYAIPLNTIEGIVRVSTYELEEYYKPDAPMYEYAGQQYRLQYLGNLLHSDHHPKLQGQALPLPVILVRGAEQPMALQVDSLMGSREIVVKSLGPQFSSVRGVSGATILGDGNVVVILDLPAMIRSDILSERQRLAGQIIEQQARQDDRPTLVMVVDDSVTVRKVTSRLLERNGMEVVTAKDGLDAVAQLQDHRPDIILLDIEMPRMDGFEVASFVRHDEHLQDTPICMITSRTGQKHRDRALAIGVNEYLGKPFQETELLATIKRLTGKE
ncbi:MAG: Hpt domain-containing protein [Marinobacter sp.]|nr:Hpt domain-containing protein [Marinobacter sp.]